MGNHFHWPYILLVFSEELEIRKWKLRKCKFKFEVSGFISLAGCLLLLFHERTLDLRSDSLIS